MSVERGNGCTEAFSTYTEGKVGSVIPRRRVEQKFTKTATLVGEEESGQPIELAKSHTLMKSNLATRNWIEKSCYFLNHHVNNAPPLSRY